MPAINDFTEGVFASKLSCFCGKPMLLRMPIGNGTSAVCQYCLRISINVAGQMVDAEGSVFTPAAVDQLIREKARLGAQRN